jgi:hypothetical protein
MVVMVKEILSMIERIGENPYLSDNERNFIGNIWNRMTQDEPSITIKQYNFLKTLVSRRLHKPDTLVKIEYEARRA